GIDRRVRVRGASQGSRPWTDVVRRAIEGSRLEARRPAGVRLGSDRAAIRAPKIGFPSVPGFGGTKPSIIVSPRGKSSVYWGMSGRALALAVYLLMVGCGRQASPPQTPAVPPTTPRRLTTAGLALNCAHVVIGPDLIRGVLTVRNTSNEPQALVDRWNGWGAYQWTLSVDGISAGNPQVHW